jgi:hypothetical protein
VFCALSQDIKLSSFRQALSFRSTRTCFLPGVASLEALSQFIELASSCQALSFARLEAVRLLIAASLEAAFSAYQACFISSSSFPSLDLNPPDNRVRSF